MKDPYVVFTVLCGITLFGSLILSFATNDTYYFLIGYPLAFLFLMVAAKYKSN